MVNNIDLDDPLHADGMLLDAGVVRITGRDVLLDSPERRKSAAPPLRRALTHDQGDGLTINFAGDFPGGVTINGVSSITPLAQEGVATSFTHRIPALVVHGDISYETLGVSALSAGVVRVPASLNTEISKIQEQLTQLAA